MLDIYYLLFLHQLLPSSPLPRLLLLSLRLKVSQTLVCSTEGVGVKLEGLLGSCGGGGVGSRLRGRETTRTTHSLTHTCMYTHTHTHTHTEAQYRQPTSSVMCSGRTNMLLVDIGNCSGDGEVKAMSAILSHIRYACA